MAHVANIRIDSTKVESDLTDFPVYVDLSNLPALFWSTVTNGGGDIRVFKEDGITELAREVVTCDTTTDTGELHIKYSGTLSSSVDTIIQIHADGSSADYAVTDTYGRNAVWTGYAMVLHLKEAVNNTANGYVDSTGNGNNGTGVSMSITAPDMVMGKGQDFDGTADYITIADSASLDLTNNFSVQCYINYDAMGGRVMDKSASGGWTSYWFDTFGSKLRTCDNLSCVSGSTTLSTGTTYKLTTSWATGVNGLKLYVNGVQDGEYTLSGTVPVNTNPLNLARSGSGTAGFGNGRIDEARVSEFYVNGDWDLTEYRNQTSPATFYTATAESPDVKTVNGLATADISSINGLE